jgi:hypothetical protein
MTLSGGATHATLVASDFEALVGRGSLVDRRSVDFSHAKTAATS